MKLTDWLARKFGTDKLLHFAFGGLICSLFVIFLLPIGFLWAWLVGLVVVSGLSVAKELWLDSFADWYDLMFAEFGCGMPLIAWLLSLLL